MGVLLVSYSRSIAVIFVLILVFLTNQKVWAEAGVSDDSRPIVRLGKDVITVGQFKKVISQLSQSQRLLLKGDESNREKFLDRLIDTRLVYLEALRTGLDKNPEVIEYLEMAKEQILVKEYFDKEIKAKIQVTREALEEFYKANREHFVVSEAIRIRHILVPTEGEALEITERLKREEDFAALAREKSIDPSAQRGGDLGWVEKRVMVPELAKVAFALQIGEISDVVESQYGYHIIRVDDRRPPEYKEFKQVEDLVRKMVARQEENRLAGEVRDKLRKGVNISIDDDLLQGIEINILGKEDEVLPDSPFKKGGDTEMEN